MLPHARALYDILHRIHSYTRRDVPPHGLHRLQYGAGSEICRALELHDALPLGQDIRQVHTRDDSFRALHGTCQLHTMLPAGMAHK